MVGQIGHPPCCIGYQPDGNDIGGRTHRRMAGPDDTGHATTGDQVARCQRDRQLGIELVRRIARRATDHDLVAHEQG